jgi:hypothetical protein
VYFCNSHTQGNADCEFVFGDPGDQLVAGDCNGPDSPALFRPIPGGDRIYPAKVFFRHTNTAGNADHEFCFSLAWANRLLVAVDIGKAGPAGSFKDCPNSP